MKTKSIIGFSLLVSVISVVSFAAGILFILTEEDINFQKTKIEKYVKLKESKVFISQDGNNLKIELPKGTILFYDFGHKDFDSYASLKIKADFSNFRDSIEYIDDSAIFQMQ